MAVATEESRRPSMPPSLGTAPGKIMGTNGHVSAARRDNFQKGIQVVDSDGSFGYVVVMVSS
jgi:hypothetical protein